MALPPSQFRFGSYDYRIHTPILIYQIIHFKHLNLIWRIYLKHSHIIYTILDHLNVLSLCFLSIYQTLLKIHLYLQHLIEIYKY